MKNEDYWKLVATIMSVVSVVLSIGIVTLNKAQAPVMRETIPFTPKEVNEMFDGRASCTRELGVCKEALGVATSTTQQIRTREYVLDDGVRLIQFPNKENSDFSDTFRLLPTNIDVDQPPDERLNLVYALSGGFAEGTEAFSIARTADHLYAFHAVFDYASDANETYGWIRSDVPTFLTITHNVLGAERTRIHAFGHTPGVLEARTATSTCAGENFEDAKIEAFLWNGTQIYRPQAPITVDCLSMYDQPTPVIFASISNASPTNTIVKVSDDLSSIGVPLSNGKTLNLKFGDADAPTASIR